jgi:hypothetical protein
MPRNHRIQLYIERGPVHHSNDFEKSTEKCDEKPWSINYIERGKLQKPEEQDEEEALSF